MIKKMLEKETVKDFGDGRFVLNLNKEELYDFLKENLPKGYIHDTFEEFNKNLKVDSFENGEEREETVLIYEKKEEDGDFELSMTDDYLYVSDELDFYFKYDEEEKKLLINKYQKFVAKKFPEFKVVWLKRVSEKKRRYQQYYGEKCKSAYQIYKDNMNASYEQYKEIFEEDCPISKV